MEDDVKVEMRPKNEEVVDTKENMKPGSGRLTA